MWSRHTITTSLLLAAALLSNLSVRALAAGKSTESGLVAHYTFQEGAGDVLRDHSGNNNHGSIKGAKWVRSGKGWALEFDGKDDYVDCGNDRSLSIGKTGSILLWFRPDTACQGGLVGWSTGSGNSNQRLVIALNTYARNLGRGNRTHEALGVYTSDGTDFCAPHRSRFHKAYFPPVDKWLFFAVTFNGRSIGIYRDGILVHSRFQALTPDTRNVPLRIGRCAGMGGASDYFKGLIDKVRVHNRALSEQEVYRLFMLDAEGRGKDTTSFGAIRIAPTACPEPGTVFADLDYRGLVPTPEGMTIKADLLNAQGAVAAAGKVRMLPAWGRAEAVFDTRDLAAGDYTVRAVATKGKSGTARINWPGRAKGWENIKVLNNLCWELLNESPGKNPRDKYAFSNPRRGWVYFITEAEGNITLSVPGADPATIHAAGKGANQEAMRWLGQGDHTLALSGNGTLKKLIVRSVPSLVYCHYPHVAPVPPHGDHEFLAKHVLPHVNTLITRDYGYNYDYLKDWANKGRHAIESGNTPRDYINRLDKIPADHKTKVEKAVEYLTKRAGMKDPYFHGIIMDEFDPGDEMQHWKKSHYDACGEACAKVLDEPKYAGRLVIPYVAYNMYDYEKSTAFVRTIVNHGSQFAWEVYLHEQDTESNAWAYINEGLADVMADWEKAIPGTARHMIVVLSYLDREDCNTGADFSVFMDMQFEHLATRPEFFGLAGIEEYQICTEEYTRWATKLWRHYCLEGRTERLSKDPYVLSHIRNGDFIDGAEAWKIQAADKDRVAVKNYKGYGHLQNRFGYEAFTETPLLWTRRSREKPNVFSQRIANLEPGRLYMVTMTTADYQELINAAVNGSVNKKHPVSIQIESAELFTGWYKNDLYPRLYRSWRKVGPFGGSGGKGLWMNLHKCVFRATGPAANLKLTDWKNAAEPGGPIGQELVFNRIEVKPYVEE